MVNLRIYGRERRPEILDAGIADGDAEIIREFELDLTRTVDPEPTLLELDDHDLLEFETPEGALVVLRGDEVPFFYERDAQRRSAASGLIDITAELPADAPDPARGGMLRRIQARILRVLGRKAVSAGAVALARQFEDSAVSDHGKGHGVFRWHGTEGPDGFTAPGDLANEGKPWLVFLHGTASSTTGSFGGLLQLDEGRAWARIEAQYAERILCLEHRTLTESPIRNALMLVEALPAGAELHLVSQSRGGLIGELIARAQLETDEGAARAPFLDDELDLFSEDAYAGQRAELVALGALLEAKQIRVTRFVRVACPAAGTGLMTERLDRWVNLLLNAMLAVGSAALGPVGTKIANGLRVVLRALVRERANPQALPGLSAMAPEQSRLIVLLNLPGMRLKDSDLVVIAGDIEGGSIWQRMAILVTDRFFGQSHDLVIESASMHRGMLRARGYHYHFAQGSKVNHFSYFRNETTARLMADALTNPAALEGRSHPLPADFRSEMDPEEEEPLISRHRSGQRDVPVLMLLPGINGSHLADESGRIWMHPLRLIGGGIRRLDISAAGVRPDGVLNRYYRALFNFLDRNHQVVAWPYDWRKSLMETADLFANDLNRHLHQTDRPVRIVAHSMGGLVARTAFARHPKLWARFKARSGARLVMLGTPNGGSFAIPLMLLGQERLMKILARFDLRHGRTGQLSIVARWPGVAQMLPVPVGGDAATSGLDLFSDAGWQRLRALDPDGAWVAPDAQALAQARAFRQIYQSAPSDPAVMSYIAGQNTTHAAIFAPAPGQQDGIRFGVAEQGDGRVLWITGIPRGLPVWYTDAAHGDLARHSPAFPAIQDILDTGRTTRLSTTPPAVRSVPSDRAVITGEAIDRLPNPDELSDIAMGARSLPVHRHQPVRPIQVRVTNGHLKFARFPVVVGHYLGDGLTGTERALDHEQGGRLSRRLERGIHPGEIGTFDAHLAMHHHPPGSLIVGLGTVTDLTSGRLQRSLLRGLMSLASAREELPGTSEWHGRPNGLSFVMIGTGGGVLPMQDCILSILRAVRDANAELGDEAFTELEFIENIEQRAIGAWQILHKRILEGEFRDSFDFDKDLGRRPGAWSRMAFDEDSAWWTPITIREDAEQKGALQYVAIAGRARAEASLVRTRRAVIERYLDDLTSRRLGEDTVSSGRTLFELLWPTALKQHSLDDRDIRLILDGSAARLPWEMLDDRRPWLQIGTDAMNERRRPPAVRHGLIRQLVAAPMNIGPGVEAARGKALVIGDPSADPSDFAPLPAAQREAREIGRMLTEQGFEVTMLIGDTARPDQVITALFTEAWQIVHIAAHGVYQHSFSTAPGASPETGIILGGKPDPVVLDAQILTQMPVVPELFFVNCCHLGAVDDPAARADRPEFAGSIAVRLINMGVRAVVAAGWEVSDRPARAFAGTLYREMFQGEGFGKAILRARKAIYESDPADTTWGAYQAYGHPEFCLSGRINKEVTDEKEMHLATPSEAISEIGRIGAERSVAGARKHAALLAQLDVLYDIARKRGWMGDGALVSALGGAWAEFGEFGKAIDLYRAAVLLEDGAARIAVVEQLAELETRDAVRAWKEGRAADTIKTIETAISRIEALNDICGPTQARLSILGSAWMRFAQLGGARRRNRALENMAQAYRAAHDLNADASARFYSVYQELLADTLRDLTARGKAGRTLRARFEGLMCMAPAQQASGGGRRGIHQAGLRLLDALLQGELGQAQQGEIIGRLASVGRDAAARRELCRATEQIEFIVDVLSTSRKAPGPLRESLETLKQTICETWPCRSQGPRV